MTYQFSAAVASSHSMRMASDELRRDLESLRDFITNAHAKMSSYNADEIAQSWLDEEIKPTSGSTIWHKAFSIPVAGKTPDQLLASMKADWTRLLDAFRARLEDANIPVELSRIGKMTYMLTDKRRPNPLTMETADLITALHSQQKRYVMLQRIARHEHDNFALLITAAIRELHKISAKADVHASPNRTEPNLRRRWR